jgi:hypothetical protein
MRFMVMGKRWLLVWVAKGVAFVARRDKDGAEQRMSKTDDGLTEGPWLSHKRIFLRHGLRGKRKLETAIHEFTHAADWSKDEEWVTQFGHDMCNFLWSIGVRFTEEPEVEPDEDPETLEG